MLVKRHTFSTSALMSSTTNVPLGESYDLIIAVDGWRVMNFLEFEDRMHDLQPGEIVYLSVVHDGKRQQVPVQVPQDVLSAAPRY